MNTHIQFQVNQKKRRRKKKKPKFGWYTKPGGKPRGAEDNRRREKEASAAQKVEDSLDNLVNPFDEMGIDQKKTMAVFLCKRRLQVCYIQARANS